MTNEEFLLHLYNSLDLSDAYHGYDQTAYEHAKKLISVAKAAKDYIEDNCLEYNLRLKEVLEKLDCI